MTKPWHMEPTEILYSAKALRQFRTL